MNEEIKQQLVLYMSTGAKQAMEYLCEKENLQIYSNRISELANELALEQLESVVNNPDTLKAFLLNLGININQS